MKWKASDARLVQSPSFPTVEDLSSPVFNRTIPIVRPEVETEEGKGGVYS